MSAAAAERPLVRCARCIMDTTADPGIEFDEHGICNHCRRYDQLHSSRVAAGETGRRALAEIVEAIKREGRGREYDCIIGVSGGVDSTYVAYLVRELGLRALAVHFDNGWNSELAVKNIEHVLKKLGIDLFTYVVDWPEFRDLQVAFLKASTPDGEIPTDHAINALLWREASRRRIRYIISGMNFALHFTAWRHASAQPYFMDPELKVYAALLAVFSVLISMILFFAGTFDSLAASFRYGAFQAVSAMTTTGFTTAGFHVWGGAIPVILMMLAFIGGCAGSTAGGLKVIRVILLYRQSIREIRRLVHPHAVLPIKVGGQKMSDTVISAVWGFFFLYITSFAVMTVLLTATGLDAETAYSAVGACITNLGPALGLAGPHYADLDDTAKVVLCVAMLLGRLEIYTLLVLLTPAFWRG